MPRRADDRKPRPPPPGDELSLLRSYPLWRRRHRELDEASAFTEWEAAGARFIAGRPGDTLTSLNRRFSLLYADGYDEGAHAEADLRVVERGRLWAAEHPDATVTAPSLAGDDTSPCPDCPAVVRTAGLGDGEGLAGASVQVITIEHAGSCPWFDQHGGDDPVTLADAVAVHYAIATV